MYLYLIFLKIQIIPFHDFLTYIGKVLSSRENKATEKLKPVPKIKDLLSKYKTPILFSGGSIVKSFAQMIVGFIIAKYISPTDLGLWATISLAITYSVFLQAGLINGLNLELPYAYGKGQEEEAKILAGTVQTFTLFSSITILLLGVSSFVFFPFHDPKIKYGVLAVTLFIMLSYYQNYLMSTFRSKNSFIRLSIIQVIDAFVNLITLIFVVYYSYYGLIIKAVFVALIYVLLLHFLRPIKVRLLWNMIAIKKLLKVGLPIFALSYIVALSSTADKLWLLKYSDLTNVGLYSFGFYAFSIFSLFSLSVASYIYPRMTYNYGKTNDRTLLWIYVKKITLLLFLIQITLASIGYFLVPVIITNYFSAYILSIRTMQILLFAGVFTGSVVGVNALWSTKNWKYMITYQVILSFLMVSLPYAGIQLFSNKLIGVTYGVLLASFLNLITGITITYMATHKNEHRYSS